MTPHQALIAARALIPDEDHWWRGARDLRDRNCECPITALKTVTMDAPWKTYTAARRLFAAAAGCACVPDWNDAPERTLAEVHAAFDAAIAREP